MKTSATSSQNPSKSPKAYATQATNCSVPESPKPGDENYISQVFHFTQVENRETKRKFASPTIDKLSYADVASSPPRKNPRLSSPALNINSNAMFPSLLFSSLSMLGSKKHTKQAAGTEGAAKSKETRPGLTKIGTKASKSFSSLPTKSHSLFSASASVSTSSSFKSAKSTSFKSSISKKFKSPVLTHSETRPSITHNETNAKNKSPDIVATTSPAAKPTSITPHTSGIKRIKSQAPIDLTSVASTTSNVASKSSSIMDVWTADRSIDTINQVPYKQNAHSDHSMIDSALGLAWGPDPKSEHTLIQILILQL